MGPASTFSTLPIDILWERLYAAAGPKLTTRRRNIVAVATLILLGALAMQGQNISDDEYSWGSRAYIPLDANALRVQSDLVEVPVVVRDSHGNLVTGLQKSDFSVYDNGKEQIISSFSVENHPPRRDGFAAERFDLRYAVE